MSKTDVSYALGALEHVGVLRKHLVARELNEQIVFDAVCMRLAAALEDASHITADARASRFGDRWHAMWATRNRIAHGYLEIDSGAIATTVEQDLDEFEKALHSIAEIKPF